MLVVPWIQRIRGHRHARGLERGRERGREGEIGLLLGSDAIQAVRTDRRKKTFPQSTKMETGKQIHLLDGHGA